MWIDTNRLSSNINNYLSLVGKVLFLCERIEQIAATHTYFSETIRLGSMEKAKSAEYYKNTLGKNKKIICDSLKNDDYDHDYKTLLDNATIARNYVAHSIYKKILFDVDLDIESAHSDIQNQKLHDKIYAELEIIYQHVKQLIKLDDYDSEMHWWFNNKDSSFSPKPKKYENKILQWVFKKYPDFLASKNIR